jgi:hypothetical protein
MTPLDTGTSLGLDAQDTGSQLGISPTDLDSSDIGLAPEMSGSAYALSNTGTGDQISLDDTSQEVTKDDTVITSHGVNALDDSDSEGELELVDPLAQTQIAPDMEDQVSLDSGSSGSGLLDLTREADDTSLGAELLEEIYPGSDENAVETQLPTGLDVASEVETMAQADIQVTQLADYTTTVEVTDPTSGAYGATLIIPFLILLYLTLVLAAGVENIQPGFMVAISGIIWPVAGGALVAALIIFFVGKAMLGSKPKGPRSPKAKKGKKAAAVNKAE